jgi:hypothetical protein
MDRPRRNGDFNPWLERIGFEFLSISSEQPHLMSFIISFYPTSLFFFFFAFNSNNYGTCTLAKLLFTSQPSKRHIIYHLFYALQIVLDAIEPGRCQMLAWEWNCPGHVLETLPLAQIVVLHIQKLKSSHQFLYKTGYPARSLVISTCNRVDSKTRL